MRHFWLTLLNIPTIAAAIALGLFTQGFAAEVPSSSGPDLTMFTSPGTHPNDLPAISEMPVADLSTPNAAQPSAGNSKNIPLSNPSIALQRSESTSQSNASTSPSRVSTTSSGASRNPIAQSDEPIHRGEFAESSPLPMMDQGFVRSEQLENVARQADRHTRHGYELAGRGAFFAARAEFLTALRLVSEGLDTEQRTNIHSHSLAVGLTAIKEAENFLPHDSRLEADLDIPRIIDAHNTPVLKDNTQGVTPMVALKCYLTFAQEQLAAATGHEVAGSIALQGLGKLHASVASGKNVRILAAEPKAVVYYQAALLVDAKNYMAANDLGVLFARCGNYPEAKMMLEYSLSVHGQAAGWQNLSVVYQQLGQPGLASQAMQQASIIRQMEWTQRRKMQLPIQDKVQWVDQATFAKTSTNTPSSPEAVQPSASNVAAQSTTRSAASTSTSASASPSTPASTSATPAAASPSVSWFPWGTQSDRK
jgi:tetratricopeptide (TPR) repeat protein